MATGAHEAVMTWEDTSGPGGSALAPRMATRGRGGRKERKENTHSALPKSCGYDSCGVGGSWSCASRRVAAFNRRVAVHWRRGGGRARGRATHEPKASPRPPAHLIYWHGIVPASSAISKRQAAA
ncbi:hypothetical protein ZWY2020_034309 [Hordeum vulgare]|nr:hypothetical protein ZWY2020_034309 [Hordeum vulgare]